MSRRDEDARHRRAEREARAQDARRAARVRALGKRLHDLEAKFRLQLGAPVGEDISEGMRDVIDELAEVGRDLNALSLEQKAATINALLGHDQLAAGDVALAGAGRFEATKEASSCTCPVTRCGEVVYDGPFDRDAIVKAARAHSVQKHEGRPFFAVAVDVPGQDISVIIESDELSGDGE